jgi:hypothetical protein
MMQNGIPFNMNFMEQIQLSMNSLFNPQIGRPPTQFQFRPNRNVFVFSDH